MVKRAERIGSQGLSRFPEMLGLRIGAHGGEVNVARIDLGRLGGGYDGEHQTDRDGEACVLFKFVVIHRDLNNHNNPAPTGRQKFDGKSLCTHLFSCECREMSSGLGGDCG